MDCAAMSEASFAPLVREKFSDLIGRHRGQACQNFGEVFLRIDSMPTTALDEGVNDGAAPTCIRVPDKEPAAFSDCGRPHVVLDEVGVDLEPPVPQVSDQGRVFVEQIAHGFAQGALGEHPRVGPDRLGPPLHRQPDGRGFLEPAPASLFGAGVLELSFQLIELAHLADEPQGFRAGFQQGLIELSTGMTDTSDPLERGGLLLTKRVVKLVAVGLHSPAKTAQSFSRSIPASAVMKLQKDVSARRGVKPKVALSRFAFDRRIEHFDRGLVNLQVIARLKLFPNQPIDRQEQVRHLFHPLHHLLAGDDHAEALPKDPLQRVVGHVVVKAAE